MTPLFVPNLVRAIKTETDSLFSHLGYCCSEHTDIHAAIIAEAENNAIIILPVAEAVTETNATCQNQRLAIKTKCSHSYLLK